VAIITEEENLKSSSPYPSLPEAPREESNVERVGVPKQNFSGMNSVAPYPSPGGRGDLREMDTLGEFTTKIIEEGLKIVGDTVKKSLDLFKPGAQGSKPGTSFWDTALGKDGGMNGVPLPPTTPISSFPSGSPNREDEIKFEEDSGAKEPPDGEEVEVPTGETDSLSGIEDEIPDEFEIETSVEDDAEDLEEAEEPPDEEDVETSVEGPISEQMGIVGPPSGAGSQDVSSRPVKTFDGYDLRMPGSVNEAGTTIGNTPDPVHVDFRADPSAVERVRMSPAELIHHMGPDFMTNKFDAFWLWNPVLSRDGRNFEIEYGDLMRPKWATDQEKFLIDHRGFAVRMSSLTVPAMFNNDYDIPFLETKISKIRSDKTVNPVSKFSLRLDQDLLWLDYLDILSGRLNTYVEPMKNNTDQFSEARREYYQRAMGVRAERQPDYRMLFNTIAKTWPWNSPGGNHRISDYGLCLIVRMRHLGNYVNTGYQPKDLPYVVFENVRILGTAESILYKRESPETQDVSVDFVFRRSYVVDPGIGYDTTRANWHLNLQDGVGSDGRYSQIEFLDRDDVNGMFARGIGEEESVLDGGILLGDDDGLEEMQMEMM